MKYNLKLSCLALACITHFASATQAAPSAAGHQILPLWGNELAAKGYDLPEPFGINVNYMNIRQNVNVDSIGFSAMEFRLANIDPLLASAGSIPLPDQLLSIHTGNTRMRSLSTSVKLDAWILPFLNIYALAGKTRGHSVSQVSLAVNGMLLQQHVMPAVSAKLASAAGAEIPVAALPEISNNLSRAIGAIPQQPVNAGFRLNFKGSSYGAGIVLTGGYKNLFALLDSNFTQTRFDILDGHINTFTLSPRIGYSVTTPAVEALHLPAGKLSVWAGSMYQNTRQTYRGRISDLNLPASLQQLLMLSGDQGRFEVKQHLSSPWNVLAGMKYSINRNVNISAEAGFARRNSLLVSAEFRF